MTGAFRATSGTHRLAGVQICTNRQNIEIQCINTFR